MIGARTPSREAALLALLHARDLAPSHCDLPLPEPPSRVARAFPGLAISRTTSRTSAPQRAHRAHVCGWRPSPPACDHRRAAGPTRTFAIRRHFAYLRRPHASVARWPRRRHRYRRRRSVGLRPAVCHRARRALPHPRAASAAPSARVPFVGASPARPGPIELVGRLAARCSQRAARDARCARGRVRGAIGSPPRTRSVHSSRLTSFRRLRRVAGVRARHPSVRCPPARRPVSGPIAPAAAEPSPERGSVSSTSRSKVVPDGGAVASARTL